MSVTPTKRDPYLGKPDEWRRLCAYLLTQAEVGLDTEGEGFKDAGASTVTVWSVAGFNNKSSPRGYRLATGYVLPAEALETFRPLLESQTVVKYCHNAPADTRAIHDTAGIVINKCHCTLQYARVALPGLDSYGLKPLACSVLGKGYRPGFAEVMGYDEVVRTEKAIPSKSCACGAEKCRKRLLPMHAKTVTESVVVTEKTVHKEYRPSEMHTGHERWAQWVAYAMEDAVDALELADYLNHLPSQMPSDPYSNEVRALARSNAWRE